MAGLNFLRMDGRSPHKRQCLVSIRGVGGVAITVSVVRRAQDYLVTQLSSASSILAATVGQPARADAAICADSLLLGAHLAQPLWRAIRSAGPNARKLQASSSSSGITFLCSLAGAATNTSRAAADACIQTLEATGCVHPQATNFDSLAVIDDGRCEYEFLFRIVRAGATNPGDRGDECCSGAVLNPTATQLRPLRLHNRE